MDITAPLQPHVTNKLSGGTSVHITGIIGDRPSQYAKSPSIWNPAFKALGINAVYLPLDVEPDGLSGLVGALRQHESYLGGSVTVPYKVSIIDLLDEVDPMARRIGAVNTLVRTPQGRLIGYNTDGQGAVDCLSKQLDGEPMIPTLDNRNVLLIGAGGAARAVAFCLAQSIGSGRMVIANRSEQRGKELAQAVAAAFGNASAISENDIASAGEWCDLVVNATTRGQAGLRLAEGGQTCLEPYSALAPAAPAVLAPQADEQAFYQTWFQESLSDMRRNNERSLETIRAFKKAAFFDLVYAPLETVTLRHARWSGHRTQNGKWMNIAQAVDAFVFKVCRSLLEQRGELEEAYRQVLGVMAVVW